MADFKYKAFVSYSHSDEKWATWLHRSLETYRLPKHLVGKETSFGAIPRRLVPIFRDRDELPTATDLGELLNAALVDSATQIVICSPRAAQSRWVNEEILAFKRLGKSHRIFCLIVEGEPYASDMPGKEEQECFPTALRFQLGEDGQLSKQPAEPIAADLRPGKDGKTNAKLKLISGMLGIGFDALRQRDAQRRQRRLVAITAASMLGMVVAFGLAATAWIARQEAVAQRARAEAEAETAQQTTDFMVDLFAVSDPSEARGNTITAREILDKGAERIELELSDQPAVQATLMETMGSVYKGLGLYPEARKLVSAALERRRRLYGDVHPEVAASETELGDVMRLQADYEAALVPLEKALAARRALLGADDPAVAETLLAIAEVRAMQGEFERAHDALSEALEIQRQHYAEDSMVVAATLQELGLNRFDVGDFEGAEQLITESIAMQKRLLGTEPHPDLAESLNNLVVVHWQVGRIDDAINLADDVLEMNRRLYGDKHPEIALALNNIASLKSERLDLDGAEQAYLEALSLLAILVGEDHPDYAVAQTNYAYLLYDTGAVQDALDRMGKSLSVYRSAFPGDHPMVADTLGNIGNWLVYDQRYDEAEPILVEARAMATNTYGDDHIASASILVGLALLYSDTGRGEEALASAAEARRIYQASLEPDHWRQSWAGSVEGAARVALAEFEQAEPLLLESHYALTSRDGVRNVFVDLARRHLVRLYRAWGKPVEAARYENSFNN